MSEKITIERMSYGPDAIGHLASGKTVFVRGGVPGTTIDVQITDEKDRYARGVVLESAQPSHISSAIAPWAYLPYEAQLFAKQSNLREALIRVAHMTPDAADAVLRPIIPSKDEWGYRNKLEMALISDDRGRLALGFHDAGTDDVEITCKCELGNRLIADAPKALTGALRYLSNGVDLGIYRVGIRGSLATKSIEVALWTPPGPFPRNFAAKMLRDAVGATSVVRVLADRGSARKVKRVEVLDGDGHWRENLMFDGNPINYQVSAPSFFQVNTKQAAKLVAIALEGLGHMQGEHAVDLYSGVGTFSIPMALSGAAIKAVELEGSAAKDLRVNKAKNNVEVDVVCDDAARVNLECAVLLVDPPRAGLDRKVVKHIADARPARIAYVSCDPQTFARDAARLAQHGYSLKDATPVDLFPQTYHCETVGIFC